MAGSKLHRAVLMRHPETSSQAVIGISASVGWVRGAVLKFTYVLNGDLTRIRVSPPAPPRRADRLWHHTCFEAFISMRGHTEYDEFNFGPSGEWAAYTFRRYREGGPLADAELAPVITVRATEEGIEMDAEINLVRRPTMSPQNRLRLGLAAVVEDEGGRLSYWALRHPPGQPDFHHRDSFVLEVELPDEESLKEAAVVKTK